MSDIPQAVGGTSNPHIEEYLVALNDYLGIEGAWRRNMTDWTAAIIILGGLFGPVIVGAIVEIVRRRSDEQ